MGLLTLILVIVAVLIILELFKHHFTKGLLKYMIIGIILLFVVLILSAYLDLGQFFSKDNSFSQTGAVIADDIGDDIDNFNPAESETLQTIGEKIEEFFNNILDN